MTAAPTLPLPDSVDAVIALLATQSYVCDRRLATALYLSLKLQRPLFLEGEPGVGKTELGKVLAQALDPLVLRVPCSDGLGAAPARYGGTDRPQVMEPP